MRGLVAEGTPRIQTPAGAKIWLVAGVTDMRWGMPGLAALVKTLLGKEPHCGDVFVFRGRRGKLIKAL